MSIIANKINYIGIISWNKKTFDCCTSTLFCLRSPPYKAAVPSTSLPFIYKTKYTSSHVTVWAFKVSLSPLVCNAFTGNFAKVIIWIFKCRADKFHSLTLLLICSSTHLGPMTLKILGFSRFMRKIIF